MNTDQLRHAAVMLIAAAGDKDWSDTIDAGAVGLAHAWIEANPVDDGEPITEAWYAAVLTPAENYIGPAFATGWASMLVPGDGESRRRLVFCGSMTRLEEFWDDVNGDTEENCIALPAPYCRGDVRRLCAALSIPLKES